MSGGGDLAQAKVDAMVRACRSVLAAIAISLLTPLARASPDWRTPLTPFRIADNLYYVGSRDLASYLVVTPAGDILIDSNLTSSPPLIRRSVEQLGFKFRDIKILLISHAHSDHAGGSATIKRLTGAKYMVMDGDVSIVESGGAKDFAYPGDRYPAAKVDRVLHDGDEVRLGGVVLVAHKTPGHTRGCTTWTMRAVSAGELRDVVIVGSWNVNPGYRLLDRPGRRASYPGIADDYRRMFAVLKGLPCDIFLGAHGEYFNMLNKLPRAQAGAGEAAWIDPEGYRAAVARHESAFEAELKRQQDAAAAAAAR
jgi:metallo-beta-lactamase class B